MKPRAFTSTQVNSTTDGNVPTLAGMPAIVTCGDIFDASVTPDQRRAGALPSQAKIEQVAKACRYGFCLDWEFDPNGVVNRSSPTYLRDLEDELDKLRRNLSTVLGWAKAENPSILVGYYRGSAFSSTYTTESEGVDNQLEINAFNDWRSRFERDSAGVLRPSPLYDQIDFFAPNLYPEKPPAGADPIDWWTIKADANRGMFALYPNVMVYLCTKYRGTEELIPQALADAMANWCDAAGFDHCWWQSAPGSLNLR